MPFSVYRFLHMWHDENPSRIYMACTSCQQPRLCVVISFQPFFINCPFSVSKVDLTSMSGGDIQAVFSNKSLYHWESPGLTLLSPLPSDMYTPSGYKTEKCSWLLRTVSRQPVVSVPVLVSGLPSFDSDSALVSMAHTPVKYEHVWGVSLV